MLLATVNCDAHPGTKASAAATNLTLLSNLTDAWQLDPANLTEQYGLHIYGSGATTGLVVDSGGSQVRVQAAHVALLKRWLLVAVLKQSILVLSLLTLQPEKGQ